MEEYLEIKIETKNSFPMVQHLHYFILKKVNCQELTEVKVDFKFSRFEFLRYCFEFLFLRFDF